MVMEPNRNSGLTETGELFRRDAPLRPHTFNDASRSVRVIAATEKPVLMFDPFLRVPVNMITLMSGLVLPASGQIPVLDSHDPSTVSSILGSARNFRLVDDALECEVFFAGTKPGKEAAQLVKEGHLTDFSVGFRWNLNNSHFIPKEKQEDINGKTIQGPARIIKKWHLLELSIVVVGANEEAKVVKDKDKPEPGKQKTLMLKIQEINIVDVIFYAIVALMVLFLFKRMG